MMLYTISLLCGAGGAWLLSRFGDQLDLLDRPNQRSSHCSVTPKGGGIGILAAFIIVALVQNFPHGFWLSATALSLFSFYGDRHDIAPAIRLLFQFTASLILLFNLFGKSQSHTDTLLFLLPLAVFIVGTTNFYNFMDGINGIAGITGFIGFGLLSCFAMTSERDSIYVVLAIALSLSCLGFLPFNFPRARVFMGDVGSILLGFVFAGMTIDLSKTVLDFVCLISFLFPFYADELTTMVVRIRRHENLIRPHRRHLYQLLANEFTISHWKISVGYGILQFLIGISILALRRSGLLTVLFLLTAYFAVFTGITWIVRTRIQPYAEKG